jgi:hypothetical protein
MNEKKKNQCIPHWFTRLVTLKPFDYPDKKCILFHFDPAIYVDDSCQRASGKTNQKQNNLKKNIVNFDKV